MLKYRTGLVKMPSYDVVERDWKIKVNANESTMNLPPVVEERVMGRLSRVAFNRYPNDELEDLKDQIAANFSLAKEVDPKTNVNIIPKYISLLYSSIPKVFLFIL